MFTKSFHKILFYKKNEKKQPFHSSACRPAETPVGGLLHLACCTANFGEVLGLLSSNCSEELNHCINLLLVMVTFWLGFRQARHGV